MSDVRTPRPSPIFLACLTLVALSGYARAQFTEPFDVLDNVEGDFVNLNAAPVRPMAITADNATLFALNTHASRILRFDLVTGATTQVVHTAKSPVSIGLWSDPNATSSPERLVVVCRDTYALLIHDRASGDVRKVLELRDSSGAILGEPGDLLIDQAASRAFVSCQAADAVAEVDLTVPSVVRVWRLPCKNPLFMCFDGNNDVLVAPLLSGNNSGARRRNTLEVNPMHVGPTVVDFETAAQNGTQLPDEDLFRLIRASGAVQALTTDVGTVLFAVGINPQTQMVWQLNTDANNKDPNRQTEESIKGDIVKNQLTISALPAIGTRKTTPFVPPIDLDRITGGYDPTRSVGQPYALAFGQFGYAVVAGLLTDNVMLLSPTGGFVSEFDLTPGSIPRALLYSPVADRVLVYCWGTNTIDVRQVGLAWTQVFNLSLGLDPTPDRIKTGRRIAYSAAHSARNNASCLSCHIEGRTDMVVWNLGSEQDDKGPMVTQTLDGIAKSVPFHWRGEQRNNLADFNPAFVNLLGANAPLGPAEFADFEAFILSLQTPPNPFEDESRVVNDTLQPVLPPGAPVAHAVKGLSLFNAACEGCHNAPTATSNDTVPDGFNFGDLNPRRKFIKVAPFNEVYRKDQDADVTTPGMQLHTVKLLPLSGSGPLETLEYPLLGAGLAHAGLVPSIHDFLGFFFPTDPQAQSDATAFVRQFDQGIAPAAYRAVLIDQANLTAATAQMNGFFVPQAVARNCDIVLFGKYTVGGVLVPMRWWFDRRRTPAQGRFVPEDGGAGRELSFFLGQAAIGQASLTCVGLPVGTGEGFGIDFDRDQLLNQVEVSHATDPDERDTDDDGWPDGHEVLNGGDPTDSTVGSNDATNPVIGRAVVQFVSAKVARINVETSEPCVIQANYSFGGGPAQSASTPVYATTHSLVLDDLRPSTGSASIVHSVTLTAVDLAGRWSAPVSMPLITTRTFNDLPGVAIVDSLSWTSMSKVGGTMTATATIVVVEKVSGPPETPLAKRRVVARIFKNGVPQSTWAAQGTAIQLAGFNVTNFTALLPFDAFTGPFLVSDLTDLSGVTTLSFSLGGLSANDEVTLNIELIGEEAPAALYPFLTLNQGSQWNMPSTPAPNRGLVERY
ncbi:MAG: hypothetical protein JNK02_17530 [Planctomycetes bacterium]|nr:hypothetical protein [Planctomycetota bacterium]